MAKTKAKNTTDEKDPEWFNEIWHKLDLSETESARAKIIIAASYVDDLLVRLLSRNLLGSSSTNDELFKPQGPLYNLGPKIELAFRMGLISSEGASLLHKLRKLREICAHTHDAKDFEDESIRSRIEDMHNRLKDDLIKDDDIIDKKFKRVFMNCAGFLWLAIEKSKPPKPRNLEAIFDAD